MNMKFCTPNSKEDNYALIDIMFSNLLSVDFLEEQDNNLE